MSGLSNLVGSVAGAAATVTDRISGPRLSILVFHRVLAQPDPLFPGELDAAQFDRLMCTVSRGFSVVTLGQAMKSLAAGSLPRRALVVTFDDGYADNCEVALPILQRHGIAATFFVASGFLNGGRMWNDTIIETLRLAAVPSIDLTEFGLGVRSLDGPAQRRSVIDGMLQVVKYQAPEQRTASLSRLATLAGFPVLPDDLMMTTDQLRSMHRSGMEIGGHTIGHPILTTLADDVARAEIDGGRRALQDLIDAPVEVFAYPNGVPDRDYDARHVDIVRGLGFLGAVTTARGAAGPEADRFQLPRYSPWGANLAQWSARLVVSRTRPHYQLASDRRSA
jgi:peptidoglycan/xylan/chitin deacetylase (PgdA/CDA1 family)